MVVAKTLDLEEGVAAAYNGPTFHPITADHTPTKEVLTIAVHAGAAGKHLIKGAALLSGAFLFAPPPVTPSMPVAPASPVFHP